MNAAFSGPPNYPFEAIRTRAFSDFANCQTPAKLTSVLAPPGYGKTILLAEIHRELERKGYKALWVGADANKGSAISFLFELEQRLFSNSTGFGEAFAYQQKPTIRERIERVLAALTAMPGEMFLVFDNTDLGDLEETRRLIDALAFETPEHIRLVVSSSTKPAFDATRALLELKLNTINAAALGFGLNDIAQLLKDAGVNDLDKSLAMQILHQSEGWPAAVRLLQVLTSTGGTTPDSSKQAWAGDGLLETLFERLLDKLQPELQTFLIEIAVFPAFSSELLAAATQSERAASYLRFLVDNNILITSLSEQDAWYRLHALFRRYLMRLATDRLTAKRQRQIALRGAQWLERHEQIADSLELALRAEDTAMCARLLEKLSWSLVRTAGNLTSFTSWVERARAQDVCLGSEARFWYLWTLIFERRYDDATQEMSSFAASLKQTSYSEERQAMLRAKIGLAEIVLKLHLDDMPAIRALAPRWLEEHAEKDRFETGATAGALALSQGAELDFVSGHTSALTSIASVAPSASVYGKAWAKNIWAHLELMQGNPREVDLGIQELQDAIAREVGQDTLIGAVTAIVRANALYHLGHEQEALTIAQTCLARASDCGLLDFVWLGLEILVPHAIREGGDNGLLNMLQEAAQRYPARLSRSLEYRRIRLHCLENRTEAAVQIAGRQGLWVNSRCVPESPAGITASEAQMRSLTVISLMTMLGEHDQAAALIEDGLHASRKVGNRRASIEYMLARSTLGWRTGRSTEAIGAFSRAIVMASETGLQSPFQENELLVQQIVSSTPLKQLGLVTDASRTFLASLTQAGTSEENRGNPDDESLTEELTKRELSLLQMLNEGKDNAQIAQHADIAVRTVKWHLRNLYAKLNVKNRTAALARAREVGLI